MTDVSDLVRDWLEIVVTGPAEAWAGRVAEDVVIRLPFAPPGVANELRGFDEAVAALSAVWNMTERFTWRDVVVRRTEDPELLVTTARSDVLLRSGQGYANSYVMLTRVRDGQVIEHMEYFNPLPVIEAFGQGAT